MQCQSLRLTEGKQRLKSCSQKPPCSHLNPVLWPLSLEPGAAGWAVTLDEAS